MTNDDDKTPAFNALMTPIRMLTENITRRHFNWAADYLRGIPNPTERKAVAIHFAKLFQAHNLRFDANRFHRAAGTSTPTSKKSSLKECADTKMQAYFDACCSKSRGRD